MIPSFLYFCFLDPDIYQHTKHSIKYKSELISSGIFLLICREIDSPFTVQQVFFIQIQLYLKKYGEMSSWM